MPRFFQRCSEIGLVFDREVRKTSAVDFQTLSGRLRSVDGVISVSDRRDSHGYQHVMIGIRKGLEPQLMLRRMAQALRGPEVTSNSATPDAVFPQRTDWTHSAPTRQTSVVIEVGANVRNGVSTSKNGPSSALSQFLYGVLAGGSFVMAWVGLLVPGIPTVPFVILTAVFAAKASPAFRRRLMESRVFGPMMEDWNTYHAIRPSARNWAIVGTVTIVSLTLIVAPASPALYVLVGMMTVLTVTVLLRLPVINEPPTTAFPSTVSG